MVHNGIIENFHELRRELRARGHRFASDTDSEVIVHLVADHLEDGLDPVAAVARALPRLAGAFALAFVFAGERDLMIGARRDSPLAVGWGDGEMYLGSDALALAPLTRAHHLSRGRRLGGAVAPRRQGPRRRRHRRGAARQPRRRRGRDGRQGRVPTTTWRKEIWEQPAAIAEDPRDLPQPAHAHDRAPPSCRSIRAASPA